MAANIAIFIVKSFIINLVFFIGLLIPTILGGCLGFVPLKLFRKISFILVAIMALVVYGLWGATFASMVNLYSNGILIKSLLIIIVFVQLGSFQPKVMAECRKIENRLTSDNNSENHINHVILLSFRMFGAQAIVFILCLISSNVLQIINDFSFNLPSYISSILYLSK